MSLAPTGGSSGASALGSGFSGLGSGLGALAGVGGLAAILAEGPGQLPQEFSQLTSTNVPWLEQQAGSLAGQGQQSINQGESALNMAQGGVLTPEQQAQLSTYSGDLKNTAAQEYSAMGRNANQDTSLVGTETNIDAHVNAMAQQQIQSTIALGLGEISAGQGFYGQALGFENAADQALIAAGQAQIQLDTNYSQALTGAFTSIGAMFGKAAMVSDVRLKYDIRPEARLPNGIGLYSFRFRWDRLAMPHVGVLAQEVMVAMPEAVERGDDGWLRVDYAKVGAPFMSIVEWRQRNGQRASGSNLNNNGYLPS